MGSYILDLQEAVFEAIAMQLSEAAVVAFVQKRVPLASTKDILFEYAKLNSFQ
jgi:hypothetical protein